MSSSDSLTRQVTGKITVHPRGFGFVTVTAPGEEALSAFIAPPALNPFLADDTVSATITRGEDGRWTGSALTLVARVRGTVFGEIVVRKGTFLRIDREVANTDWPIDLGGIEARAGDAVLAKVVGTSLQAEERIDATADLHLSRVMARYNLTSSWKRDVLESAARAAQIPHALGARRDLREIPTVTVDAPSTRDIDDAISVLPASADGAMRLLVSIADASAFVTEGTALDREASARSTSVYLAGRVLPMLPDSLSAEWISLLPGQERLCLSVEMRIDPEGRVTASDVYESVVRSWARLDYDEMAGYLERGLVSARMEPVRDALPWFRTASARLASARARRGGIVVDRDEARVTFDPVTGRSTGVERVVSNAAHAMIERFMVAANEAIGVWLFERGVPAPYRVHAEPEADAIRDLSEFAHNFGFEAGFGPRISPLALSAFDAQISGSASEPALRSVLRRTLGPALYTVHPSQHFGLAAPLYLHFTSPIRRYADLLVHRTVKQYLHGRRDFLSGDPAIDELCAHINERARAAGRAEADRRRMLEADWMRGRVGETFAGRITRIRPFGIVVQIDATLIEGTVPTDALADGPYRTDARETSLIGATRSYMVGMPLRVRVVSADPALGRTEFALDSPAPH